MDMPRNTDFASYVYGHKTVVAKAKCWTLAPKTRDFAIKKLFYQDNKKATQMVLHLQKTHF